MPSSPAAPTQASWKLVMPSECRCDWPATRPVRSSASVAAGTCAETRRIAPSCSAPVGRPASSRSIRPSAGSGVLASMPAIVSAAVFTQALWWSRFGRKAGRPPVTVSRSAAVGSPPGKADMVQPPPSTQACGSSAAQYSATVSRHSCRDRSPTRLQRRLSSPPPTGCTCASPNAGSASRPRRSITRVRRPVSSRISSSLPTARMTPSRTASACTNPDGCAGVLILPPASTRSASLLLTAQASHTARRPRSTPRCSWSGGCDPIEA